jgi:hypothetical protein
MSNCNDRPATPTRIRLCPVSATPGKEVDLQTVKALLREHSLRRISTLQHHFCANPACEVVYFDEAGVVYRKDDIRVAVWQKEPGGRRMICYCFDENEADLLAEFEQAGTTAATSRVRAHIAAGRCACEVRNPSGGCCLGDVLAAVARIKQTVAAQTPLRS